MAVPLSYNIRSIGVRKATAVMTALGIALPVAVLLSMLALVEGLRTSLAATGDPSHIIVMRKGSTSELTSNITREQFNIIKVKPGIAQNDKKESLASLEMVSVIRLASPDAPDGINITLRGLLPGIGFDMRPAIRIVDGQKFHAGSREVIVGKGIASRYPTARMGSTLRFGRGNWTVVGVFDAGRSAANSEIFADLDQVAADYGHLDTLSSVLVRANTSDDVKKLIKDFETDRQLKLFAQTERSYYDAQTDAAIPIQTMGFIIAMIMAFGSSFAVMNTMYAGIARRSAEIGTLRVLGFSKFAILLGFLLESVILAVFGGLLGCIMVLPLNNLQAGIGNFATFSEITFGFQITPIIMLKGLTFSVGIGALGGLFPAWMASHRGIVQTLRET
jgi:putative ABC transport system permease protein